MKKKLVLTAIATLLLITVNAQTTFQKTFGGTSEDQGSSVQQTSDGGYIITGNTSSFGAGSDDVYLIKTDANGNSLWTKTFEGIGYVQYGYCVKQTSDGGYIITGATNNFGLSYIVDVYLIKTDANGNSLWIKAFGGTNDDEWGHSVQQTTDGGYIIVGVTQSFGAGNNDVYLIKTDGNGNSLWTKTFGGTSQDEGYSVQQTSDGGYIITGLSSSPDTGDPDVYLIKTDANGNSLWTKTFGGASPDEGYSVQQTSDGGYIIAGKTQSSGASVHEVYLIKTDANGNSLWTKTFGGGVGYQNYEESGYSVQQTSDGGYIIAGTTTVVSADDPDVYLIKTDGNGNVGVDEFWVSGFGFQIYPNPTTGKFIVSNTNHQSPTTNICIYNVLGEKVYATSNFKQQTSYEIDLSNSPKGIYFVKIYVEEKFYTEKMVIQ